VDLAEGELLTELRIAVPEQGRYGTHFIKLGKRKGHCISIINIAVFLEIDESDLIRIVRVAMGTVAPIPMRLYRTEEFLVGKTVSDETISEATDIMMREISPRDSFRAAREYREAIAPVIFQRAVKTSLSIALE